MKKLLRLCAAAAMSVLILVGSTGAAEARPCANCTGEKPCAYYGCVDF